MPALLILKGLKAQRDGTADQDATSSDVLEALEAAFQPGELDRLLKTGIDFEHLVGIYTWAQRRWSGSPEPEAGEAQPPATGEPEHSSSDSISSKATSNGNTASTSGGNSTPASTGDDSSRFSVLSQTALSGG